MRHRAIGLRAHGLSADAGPARASRPLRLFSIAARITRHAPPSPAATGCPRPLETPAHRGVDQAQRTTGTDLTADKPAPTRRKASTRVTTGPAPPDDTGRPRHGPTQTNPKPLRPTRRLRERSRPELTLTQILRNPMHLELCSSYHVLLGRSVSSHEWSGCVSYEVPSCTRCRPRGCVADNLRLHAAEPVLHRRSHWN